MVRLKGKYRLLQDAYVTLFGLRSFNLKSSKGGEKVDIVINK